MRAVRPIATLLALSITSATLAPSAFAAPRAPKAASGPESEARRLKREGDALMDRDKYADALALYARAYELSGDPALLFNQGRALEALGDYPEALDMLERFERDATPALRAKTPGLAEHMEDLRQRIATLVVRSNVPGARLLVREKAAGTLGGELRLRTRAGPATVEVVADGYEPFRQEVELGGGSTLVVEAKLVPRKSDALLVVRTRPSADLTLDGKPLGRSPLEVRVRPGTHELLATAPGYVDDRMSMTLELGDRRDVELELRKTSTPVTGRWWFWTGIVVVLAGGAATAYALTTERDASRGTFQPGQVPGP